LETLIEEFAEFTPDDRIGIISTMDHMPGQRQFADLAKFESYVRGKNPFGDQGFCDYANFSVWPASRAGRRSQSRNHNRRTPAGHRVGQSR